MEPLQPEKTLVEKTYDAILEAISSGQFQPGERLNQDELAERLGVSRQPVNSAIAMLKAQRFLQDTGKRGVIVAPVDREMFLSIYQIREALDPLAARLATPRITKEAITLGRQIIEQGKICVQSGDQTAVLRADMAFHELIYRLSGNAMLRDVMALNWRHLQRSMSEVLRVPGMSLRVWKEHDQIFSAIVNNDADRAAALMAEHLKNAVERTTQAAARSDDAEPAPQR